MIAIVTGVVLVAIVFMVLVAYLGPRGFVFGLLLLLACAVGVLAFWQISYSQMSVAERESADQAMAMAPVALLAIAFPLLVPAAVGGLIGLAIRSLSGIDEAAPDA